MGFADTKLSKVDGYRLAQQILLTSVIITITTKWHWCWDQNFLPDISRLFYFVSAKQTKMIIIILKKQYIMGREMVTYEYMELSLFCIFCIEFHVSVYMLTLLSHLELKWLQAIIWRFLCHCITQCKSLFCTCTCIPSGCALNINDILLLLRCTDVTFIIIHHFRRPE